VKTIRTDRARKTFLETLRTTCNVSAACRATNMSRSAAYAWRKEDEAFSEAWTEAETEAVDNLEGVAYQRAMAGESDRMLEILLKGHRPERYVERRQVDFTGKIVTEIQLTGPDES
jgi:hypothetical protein